MGRGDEGRSGVAAAVVVVMGVKGKQAAEGWWRAVAQSKGAFRTLELCLRCFTAH